MILSYVGAIFNFLNLGFIKILHICITSFSCNNKVMIFLGNQNHFSKKDSFSTFLSLISFVCFRTELDFIFTSLEEQSESFYKKSGNEIIPKIKKRKENY